MTPDDARKLIGGYATGNLSDEERKALFDAALIDQDLFDSLVKEQALKGVLDEPSSRKYLLDQLQPRRRFFGSLSAWRWAAAGSLALATVSIAVVILRTPETKPSTPVLTGSRLPAPTAAPIRAPESAPMAALRETAPLAQSRPGPKKMPAECCCTRLA